MKELFLPDRWARSAYEIDYRSLYEEGIRGLIFDIDNTLVDPNAPANKRAGAFAHEVGSPVVTKALKPFPHKYREAMRVMGTDEETTAFIGDQIYTDIWGANNAKVLSILTDPLTQREEFWIRWKRRLEAPVRRKIAMRQGNGRQKQT